MATHLDAGEVKRRDYFLIDPEQIITDWELNGRECPHSDEDIAKRAESIVQFGQITPIQGRRVQGNKVQISFGFLRLAAIRKINAEKLTAEPMKVKVIVADQNDEEAFLSNLVENMHRKDLSPLDHAHNQRVLRDRFGYDEDRIAKFYAMSPSYVSVLRKSLQMPASVQEVVKAGELPFNDAKDMLDLPAPVQTAIVEEAKVNGNGKVDAKVVKAKTRAAKIEQGGAKPRTLAEVRTFFEELTGPAEPEQLSKFCKTIVKFIQGSITEQTLERHVKELCK